MAAPQQPDPSKAEPVDKWEADPESTSIRATVVDGGKRVNLKVEFHVTGILRLGNNTQTGEPIYNVQNAIIIKTLQWDRGLKALPRPKDAPESAYR